MSRIPFTGPIVQVSNGLFPKTALQLPLQQLPEQMMKTKPLLLVIQGNAKHVVLLDVVDEVATRERACA